MARERNKFVPHPWVAGAAVDLTAVVWYNDRGIAALRERYDSTGGGADLEYLF